MLEQMCQAKAKRDAIRDRIMKTLKTYELPEEIKELLAEDDLASVKFWDAFVAYECSKAAAKEKQA